MVLCPKVGLEIMVYSDYFYSQHLESKSVPGNGSLMKSCEIFKKTWLLNYGNDLQEEINGTQACDLSLSRTKMEKRL